MKTALLRAACVLASLLAACTQEPLESTAEDASTSEGPGGTELPDASAVSMGASSGAASSSSSAAPMVSSSSSAAPASSAAPSSSAPAPSSSAAPSSSSSTTGDASGFRRFIAIGDTGTGGDTQMRVASAIGQVCMARGGCDFGLLLGDNFYDSGVDSVEDERFNIAFVTPYGPLGFPFYAVLGNHDYGGEGAGIEPYKGARQVDYSEVNPQWRMPSTYYQADEGPLWLLGLNTTAVFWGVGSEQENTVPGWIQAVPSTKWKIAFGHHPYKSNGKHGNAGSYEGLSFVPIISGEAVKDFAENVLCGHVDVYICGHDHSRQDLGNQCGTELLVSGAGAKVTELPGDGPSQWQDNTPGFLLVEATPTTMIFRFFDENGMLNHERTITRP